MASATAKVRLVRCPKCLKLLPERADVPMYKCGGCGAILRAKNRTSCKQDVSSVPETQIPSRNDFLDSPDSANCHFEKGESSNAAEDSRTNYAEVDEEKSLKCEEHVATQSNDNLISSMASSNAEVLSQSAAASEEETIDPTLRVMLSNHPRSSTASSSYDGSQTFHEKYRQMSRRTYLDSIGTSSNQGESISRSSTANADVRRGMSTKSDAFYSVNSWVEPEDGPSRSLSRRTAFSGDSPTNCKKLELLKLVEELRDQLTETKQSVQDTYRRSYQCPRPYRPSQMPPSYPYPYSRPKARTTKSYCRPVSGGAPFVACNNCFEVLRMPADFLISTKTRLNKLQCGGCSEITVLSFPARDREALRTPSEPGKTPEDPISFSEDYGISFADSSSMEAEAVLHVSKASSRAGDSEKASLHRLMGYPSARELLF